MSNQYYQLGDNEPLKLDAKLLYITEAKYGSDWHSIKHTHHFTELFYITNGSGTFYIDNETFPVKKNNLIIVNPNTPHTECGHPDTPFEYIALGLNRVEFSADKKPSTTNYIIRDISKNKDDIYSLLKIILKEVRNKDENFETICQNLLEVLVIDIIRTTHTDVIITSSQMTTKECKFIEQYIDEHFRDDITLQTLSELTYLNKYYLVHTFKNYKGISPISYLIDRRIQEAKHLLETTNHPVTKIAELCGFSSQSYFSQIFKKETSMTPNTYRKFKLESETQRDQ